MAQFFASRRAPKCDHTTVGSVGQSTSKQNPRAVQPSGISYRLAMSPPIADMVTRRTPFVTLHVTGPARGLVREATWRASVNAGRRRSVSELLVAAFRVAEAHPDELTASIDEHRR